MDPLQRGRRLGAEAEDERRGRVVDGQFLRRRSERRGADARGETVVRLDVGAERGAEQCAAAAREFHSATVHRPAGIQVFLRFPGEQLPAVRQRKSLVRHEYAAALYVQSARRLVRRLQSQRAAQYQRSVRIRFQSAVGEAAIRLSVLGDRSARSKVIGARTSRYLVRSRTKPRSWGMGATRRWDEAATRACARGVPVATPPRGRFQVMVRRIIASLAAVWCIGLFIGCAGAQDGNTAGKSAEPKFEAFDAGRFTRSIQIDNRWMPLTPGTRFVYEGTTIEDDGTAVPHRVVINVTDLTKLIGGVRAVITWDLDYSDGELVEAELAFFAQDTTGTVWRMGEYPEEYDGGKFVAAPAWIHGFEDARAGIMMKAKPQVGTPSYSEDRKSVV